VAYLVVLLVFALVRQIVGHGDDGRGDAGDGVPLEY
jgi:hypothetical protein